MNYSSIFDSFDDETKGYLLHDLKGRSLILANENYAFDEKSPLTPMLIRNINLVPRCLKPKAVQKERTKKKAEVFTPVWVINEQCNLVDNAYLGKENVFSTGGKDFTVIKELSLSGAEVSKADYIASNRMEVACGEAPYMTTRYDTETGELIPFEKRIGFLDRKLKLCKDRNDIYLAVTSCYGFEFQGDSLLIARMNILLSCLEALSRLGVLDDERDKHRLSFVIMHNFFQADGITGTFPLSDESAYYFDWENNCMVDFKEQIGYTDKKGGKKK